VRFACRVEQLNPSLCGLGMEVVCIKQQL